MKVCEFASVCIMCSACCSMYIPFTAVTPTHMKHSADAETSAQRSSVSPRVFCLVILMEQKKERNLTATAVQPPGQFTAIHMLELSRNCK